jgi:cyclopropane fatty-acyl-phospholipid synthase-like methyltransferase
VSTSTYVFDPEWTMERDRLRALESLFDDASMRHLASLGVTEGWRCLEVGCGAGGIARWLAGRVGSSGQVVATDLDSRFVTDALEERAFDLAHARAVIIHIPDHQGALERVVATACPPSMPRWSSGCTARPRRCSRPSTPTPATAPGCSPG